MEKRKSQKTGADDPAGFGAIPIHQEAPEVFTGNGGEEIVTGHRLSARKKSGRPRRHLLLAVLLLLLLTAVYAGAGYLLGGNLLARAVTENLGALTGMEAAFAKARFDPFLLRLDLFDMTLAPSAPGQGVEGTPFLQAARVRAKAGFGGLLRGRLEVKEVLVTRPEIQLCQTRAGQQGIGEGFGRLIAADDAGELPPWLHVKRLRIEEGVLACEDAQTGKQRRFTSLYGELPVEKGFHQEQYFRLEFELYGIPVRLVRFETVVDKGQAMRRAELELAEAPLARLSQFFLADGTDLQIAEGVASARAIVSWPAADFSALQVEVEAEIDGVQLTTPDGAIHAESATMVVAGDADVLRVRDLHLENPRVDLPARGDLLALSRQLGRSLPLDALPERLSFRQGIVRQSRTSAGHKELARALSGTLTPDSAGRRRLELSWSAGDLRCRYDGEIDAQLVTRGAMRIEDARLDQFPLSWAPSQLSIFRRGTASFTGNVTLALTAAEPTFIVESGTLTLENFAAALAGKEVFSGTSLVCSNISGNSCGSTELVGGRINADLWQHVLKRSGGALLSELGVLRLKGATLALNPGYGDGRQLPLVLEQVVLGYSPASEEKPGHLTLRAAIGKQGSLQVQGDLAAGGEGVLQLDARNMEAETFLPLVRPFFPADVNAGVLNLQGELRFPDKAFTGQALLTKVQVKTGTGVHLAIPELAVSGLAWAAEPFQLRAAKVQGDGNLELDRWESLTAWCSEPRDPGATPLQLDTLSLEGRVLFKTGIMAGVPQGRWQGTLTASRLHKGDCTFDVALHSGQSRFATTGRLTGAAPSVCKTTMDNFPLASFAGQFGRYDLDVSGASADWQLEQGSGDVAGTATLTLRHLQGTAAEMRSALALLRDTDQKITLELDHLEGQKLFSAAALYLARQRVKATLDPALVLGAALPAELRLQFAANSSLVDLDGFPEGYSRFLQEHPGLQVSLQGAYGEEDRSAQRAVLQEEEYARIALEAARLEQQRAELLHRGDLAALDLLDALEPPTPKSVKVPEGELIALARLRAAAVRDDLINLFGIHEDRILLDPEIAAHGAYVLVRLRLKQQ
ncbi:MAG: hypothetical protein CSA34_01835 [Desulfobulbus propionicus]|nr:MAG: hypothetical protein CSA34_01835 [Desulfobulbus propionicus]